MMTIIILVIIIVIKNRRPDGRQTKVSKMYCISSVFSCILLGSFTIVHVVLGLIKLIVNKNEIQV